MDVKKIKNYFASKNVSVLEGLWEVGAKRRLNGISKVNRLTNGHADGHFNL